MDIFRRVFDHRNFTIYMNGPKAHIHIYIQHIVAAKAESEHETSTTQNEHRTVVSCVYMRRLTTVTGLRHTVCVCGVVHGVRVSAGSTYKW